MSIIYNGQTVAGVYTEQILNNADTINAGIIKIATQEEVDTGENNTSAVTPLYLSSKQNKLKSGDNISIENDIISCDIKPDVSTIIQNEDGTLTNVGQLTKSGTIKIDWEGTQAEYNVAYLNGTIQPDWYCYITDDEEFVDYGDIANQSLSNLKAEGEARFDAKSNIDLDNLSEIGQSKLDIKADKATTLNGYGITDGLNTSQITNCILEIPQRIKVEIKNGIFILKAGSEVTIPNGLEADGTTLKFDYVTIENDFILGSSSGNVTSLHFFQATTKTLTRRILDGCYTSETAPTTSLKEYDMWYDTKNNYIKRYVNGSWSEQNFSLPFCIATDTTEGYTTIDQVFNGMGFMGSTLWVDKGVKGLIPNGRNEDGTLKNIEINTTKLTTATNPFGANPSLSSCLAVMTSGAIGVIHRFIESTTEPTTTYTSWFNPITNKILYAGATAGVWMEQNVIPIASLNWTYVASPKTNTFTSLIPKQPFRAVDYNDLDNITRIGQPQLSLDNVLPSNCVWLEGATVSRTTYSKLFAIYGTTYGAGDGSTTFVLPDFRNRAIWGSNGFGYLSAGLPNITATMTEDISQASASGAIAITSAYNGAMWSGATNVNRMRNWSFDASRSNSIYGKSSTVQPPAIKVRVYAKYQ